MKQQKNVKQVVINIKNKNVGQRKRKDQKYETESDDSDSEDIISDDSDNEVKDPDDEEHKYHDEHSVVGDSNDEDLSQVSNTTPQTEDDEEEEEEYVPDIDPNALKLNPRHGLHVPIPKHGSWYFYGISVGMSIVSVILFWAFCSQAQTAYSFVILFALSLCTFAGICWVYKFEILPSKSEFEKLWHDPTKPDQIRMNRIIPMGISQLGLIHGLVFLLLFEVFVFSLAGPNMIYNHEWLQSIPQESIAQFVLLCIFQLATVLITAFLILALLNSITRTLSAIESDKYRAFAKLQEERLAQIAETIAASNIDIEETDQPTEIIQQDTVTDTAIDTEPQPEPTTVIVEAT